ncbi:hypothetical protein T439DRAFT_357835 [Meredithblackwellia eburnea MCA 4105]
MSDQVVNPFDALLVSCGHDPSRVEAAYASHRSARALTQHDLMLSSTFEGLKTDEVLLRKETEDGFQDPRYGISLVGRPKGPAKVLVEWILAELGHLKELEGQWIAPISQVHITLLEVAHSLPSATHEEYLRSPAFTSRISSLCDLEHLPSPSGVPPLLHSPVLNLDPTAISLSFLPRGSAYHQLRQILFSSYGSETSPALKARYIHPSAHLTVVRFLKPIKGEKVRDLVKAVSALNVRLSESALGSTIWNIENKEETRVECTSGQVWYGGGDVIASRS